GRGHTPAGRGGAAPAAEGENQAVPEHSPAAGACSPAVSTSEARALIELLAARGIAQGQLAALLGLEKSTVSRLAAGLERKGWLRRGRDEENQRFVRLYLTPEGRVIAAQVWQAWQSRQARILAGPSAQERGGRAARAAVRAGRPGRCRAGARRDAAPPAAAPPRPPSPAGAPAAPEMRRHPEPPPPG